MNNPAIQAIGVARMPEIAQGDDIGSRIIEALRTGEITIVDRDVLIVAQKIVSKAEGRTVQRLIRTFNLFDFFFGVVINDQAQGPQNPRRLLCLLV